MKQVDRAGKRVPQTYRQTDRQKNRQTDKQTDRQTETETETEREKKKRKTERHTQIAEDEEKVDRNFTLPFPSLLQTATTFFFLFFLTSLPGDPSSSLPFLCFFLS